ncbi:hypothetical protein DPMN_166990 [Dreissena polymorpha]|uniref:Uncharacterized protein n=1 Tax=Dreissena polymorpha TaxID=45954 RepID=A0A9D4EZK7_DREPO|nr:hypothetical protein DPMN_166990 [Dreissena polymorpha]
MAKPILRLPDFNKEFKELYRRKYLRKNYDHEIIYKTGKTNPSDYLSRINYSKSDIHVKSQENIHTLPSDNIPLTPSQPLAPIQTTNNNHSAQVNILTRKQLKETLHAALINQLSLLTINLAPLHLTTVLYQIMITYLIHNSRQSMTANNNTHT